MQNRINIVKNRRILIKSLQKSFLISYHVCGAANDWIFLLLTVIQLHCRIDVARLWMLCGILSKCQLLHEFPADESICEVCWRVERIWWELSLVDCASIMINVCASVWQQEIVLNCWCDANESECVNRAKSSFAVALCLRRWEAGEFNLMVMCPFMNFNLLSLRRQ